MPGDVRWRAALAVLGSIMLLFLVLPLLFLLLRGVPNVGLVADAAVQSAIIISIQTTFTTAALTVVFGTPLAYILARWNFRARPWVNLAVELPIVLPPAVAGLALLVTFGRRGVFGPALMLFGLSLPFTINAVILAQFFVSAPFYIRAAVLGFQAVPRDLEEAARVDGASEWHVFRYVTLPLSLPALTAGLVLSWARALGEFGATILFAGSLQGRTQTMPLLVYTILERDIDAAIFAGVLLVLLAACALVFAQQIPKRFKSE